ncbi:hypothetical protein L21SP2_1636 [Salinispira pacifica]|uniref:Uncharacterized protein n=2 Tax=Salinispira pacifica TaxID=1307761 RepID=V5WIQ5_9SPIO|nr:hypothetical protein L21SP2_1636 [Salinispira pacifica]
MLFVDLDGVLVDFDRGVKEVTGKLPHELSPREMWPRLAKSGDFYNRLHWMPDGRQLWDELKHMNPVILTGLPMGNWAEAQKRSWCARELGEDVEVITCMSREKAKKARERAGTRIPVLIDDRLRLKEAWEEMGGIFIHHTDAVKSLRQLGEKT